MAFGTTELHVLRSMRGGDERFRFYLTLGKGLDPKVLVKGSGVEWLEEIPSH